MVPLRAEFQTLHNILQVKLEWTFASQIWVDICKSSMGGYLQVKHEWTFASQAWVDICKSNLSGDLQVKHEWIVAIQTRVDIRKSNTSGFLQVKHEWIFASQTWMDICKSNMSAYLQVKHQWIFASQTWVDRRLGVETEEWGPPPANQAQCPSPSHRTHDTTDQWRDQILEARAIWGIFSSSPRVSRASCTRTRRLFCIRLMKNTTFSIFV